MNKWKLAGAVLWLGAVACAPSDFLTEPLALACPTLTTPLVESLLVTLEDLEDGNMGRMDALDFAADTCAQNSVRGTPEQILEDCEACANAAVVAVYDAF